MSENDRIHFRAHFENWKKERGQVSTLGQISSFLYYCIEHYTKLYGLTDEEILQGITDGASDGGVDAIYFLADGVLVTEDGTPPSKETSKVNLLFFQIKESNTGFKSSQIDKFYTFTEDYLDLSAYPDKTWSSRYNDQVLSAMKLFKETYPKISMGFPSIDIKYFYITKGDSLTPHSNSEAAAARVCGKAKQHFSGSSRKFNFENLQALLSQVQVKVPTSRSLECIDLMPADDGFICIVGLKEYYNFIRDEDGSLSQRIFEANVRGWQKNTSVNRGIMLSLEHKVPINFWLLNNGITVLSTKAATEGKNRLKIKDPQIVNGLQTSRAIYGYCEGASRCSDERGVLVRVIPTQDKRVYGEIVRATNSQNKMVPASLRAHDKIQVQIDDLFRHHGLFYDRRKGQYKDERKPIGKIISTTELVQAVLSAFLLKPNDARGRPGRYWGDKDYDKVFSENHNLRMFLSSVLLFRRVSGYLGRKKDLSRASIYNIKCYVVTVTAGRMFGKNPTSDDIATLDVASITDSQLEKDVRVVWNRYIALGGDDKVARGSDLVIDLLNRI